MLSRLLTKQQPSLNTDTNYYPLHVLDLESFLAYPIPAREYILSPILQEQSLSMIFAKRGVGKTFFALNIGYAIASGGEFIGYKASRARRALYIDGEMPARLMQERLAKIIETHPIEAQSEKFFLLTPDLQEMGMPDLGTEDGQFALTPYIDKADVIIVDNISTLVRSGKENEAEGWLPVQEWALRMRTQGKSVIFVHHAGKGGAQRGTSRREDVLDLVIELRHPDNYQPDQGARFQVHYTKTRHLFGEDAEPMEVAFKDGGWTCQKMVNDDHQRVMALRSQGLSVRNIEAETGISKSAVSRMVKSN